MAAQTFQCPHCSAQYPVKPVLIGRVVRCSQCQKPFRLQPSGVAEKVAPQEMAAPESKGTHKGAAGSSSGTYAAHAAPNASSSSYAPQSAARARRGTTSRRDQPIPDSDALARKSSSSESATGTARVPQRRSSSTSLNAKQERTRRLMSSTLNQAATQALTSSAVKKEQPQTQKSSIQSKEIGPAVLTGQGSRPRLIPVWLWVTLLSLLAVIFLWAFWPSAPESRVLERFGAGQAAFLAGSGGVRSQARQALILPGGAIQPISSLSEHRLGGLQEYSLQPLQEILGDLRPLPQWSLWIASNHYDRAIQIIEQAELNRHRWEQETRLLKSAQQDDDDEIAEELGGAPVIADPPLDLPDAPPPVRQVFLQEAEEMEWEVVREEDIRRDIAAIPQLGELLLELFAPQQSVLRSMAAESRLPLALQIRDFSGVNGYWNMGYGDPQRVSYRGRLIRLLGGEGNAESWRLFELVVRE